VLIGHFRSPTMLLISVSLRLKLIWGPGVTCDGPEAGGLQSVTGGKTIYGASGKMDPAAKKEDKKRWGGEKKGKHGHIAEV